MINNEELYQLVLDHLPFRVFWKDKNSRFLGANLKFAQDAGVNSPKELIGKTDMDMAWSASESIAFVEDDRDVIKNDKAKLKIEEPQRRSDGEIHWLETNKLPLKDETGNIIGLVGTYKDITEEKRQRLIIEKLALQDRLTDLPNRNFVKKHIDDLPQRYSLQFAVLFINLDYFKTINDTCGHHVGDQLLKVVGEEIEKTVGNRGFVARMEGDEFCVVYNQATLHKTLLANVETLAKNILNIFKQSFCVEKHILYLGASIGISLFEGGELSSSKLFREADLAMYQAKSIGRNAYVFFSDKMKKKADTENNILMKLRQAVDQNEFSLVYQPQFDQQENCIGAEALMRWQQPDGKFIPPDQFISVAEKIGLIHPMGDWLLDECCRLQELRKKMSHKGTLAINISPIQFRQEDFVEMISSRLLKTNLPATLFEIEVTESLLLNNQEVAFERLSQLRAMGFTIAIDDFGTGFSSLSYLSRLPVDKLKIDRAFVMSLFKDEKNQIIVKMILQMAKSLGIKTVAEGVESQEEFEFLKAHGCDYFQGYYFSKPILEVDYCQNY